MNKSCATCTKPGVSCRGPRLESMTGEQAIALCKARKAFLRLSNQVIADRVHMSKGTIDGLFAGAHTDFRFETIRPVWNELFGGDMPEDSCQSLTDGERASYEAKIHQLENNVVWHEDKIQELKEKNKGLQATNAAMQTLITNTNKQAEEDKKFLQKQIDSKSNTIRWLIGSLVGCAVVAVVSIVLLLT